MAGRPKMMAKRVGDVEVQAYELADQVARLIPEQYRTNPDPGDMLAKEWNDLFRLANRTWSAAGDLGITLRDRAGLPEDGPTDQCRLHFAGERRSNEETPYRLEEPETANP